MRKIYSLLLMATALLISGNLWAQNVAKIGTTEYATLAEAVVAVGENETIVLINNVEFGNFGEDGVKKAATALTIPAGKKFTLDLAGFTISGTAVNASTSGLIDIDKEADLTVMDSSEPSIGKIWYKSTRPDPSWGYGTYTIYNYGHFTLLSGRIDNMTNGGASYAVENHLNWVSNDAVFDMKGGIVNCPNGDQAVRLYSNSGQTQTYAGKSIMNMTGGVIEAGGIWTNDQVWNRQGGYIVLNISGDAVVYGMLDFIGAKNKTTINITGGTFHCNQLRLRETAGLNSTPYCFISGGNWDIKLLDNQNGRGEVENTMVITGGVFKINQSVEYANGTYTASGKTGTKVSMPIAEFAEFVGTGHYAAVMCQDDESGAYPHWGHKYNAGACADSKFWLVIDGEGEGKQEDTSKSGTWGTGAEGAFTTLPDDKTDVTVKTGQTIIVTEGTTAETNRLVVESGAAVIVENGAELNIGFGGVVVGGDQSTTSITVRPGGVLTSEGTVVSAKNEDIIIEADANGSGSVLVAPDVNFNQQPNATVNMHANVGHKANNDLVWHRFAMPVKSLASAWTKDPNRGTSLYEWNYDDGDWAPVAGGSTGMKPFYGYNITTPNEEVASVTYTFKGQILGNVADAFDFTTIGYGFFGNSYTGYILAKNMLAGFKDVPGVEGQVWMWNATNQSYSGVSLADLEKDREDLDPFEREVAPMQTFILKTNSGAGSTINIDYEQAIWSNPRYGLVSTASAPARAQANNKTYAKFIITSANGQTDRVRMTESEENSDEYENGVDATKYMNENTINLYTTVDGEDYTSLYTDNMLGKQLTLQTLNEISYTLTIDQVEGNEYALRDVLTDVVIPMVEGTTYTFTAQPNSTSARFEVVSAKRVTTGMENTSATKGTNGIYTVLGQFVGETAAWDNLPAGVYIVDGVKVVK